VVAIGYLLMVAGFAGFTWGQGVNRHFEATVRIQSDRDHEVIDTGPMRSSGIRAISPPPS
jgi:protein-S-isoprenylcysteine O-methyltransferase Ste14